MRVSGDPDPANNGLFTLYSDHLGSVSAMSDENGVLVPGSLARYTPFGGWRTQPTAGLTDRGFTGHKSNNLGSGADNLGLIYMQARFFVPNTNRWIAPDSIVPDPTNPQSFNKYSYVLNSPLNFSDPTGHSECGVGQNHCPGDSSLPPLEGLPGQWPDPSSTKFRTMLAEVAREMGIPFEILYGTLYAEMALDTNWLDGVETWLLGSDAGAWIGVQLRSNPGPGIGNTHIASMRQVAEYFAENHPSIDLGFSASDSTESIARFLTDHRANVRAGAAYIRMMADYRFGSNGEPLIQSHADLSQWTLEDGLAMWHSFRYGVHGINDGGAGFDSVSDFQNSSLNTNQFFGVIRGPGARDSVHDAIPFFEALGVAPNPGAPWNP